MICRKIKLSSLKVYMYLMVYYLKNILRNKNTRTMILFSFACLCMFIVIGLYGTFQETKVLRPDWAKTEDYPSFEPELHHDFPTGSQSEPRIPHILHQAYKNQYVPLAYAYNIKSFLHYNDNWKYHFWTEKSARQLIRRHHRPLLGTFDSYSLHKAKSEILRYVVLYEFGGVFADISIECLRPLKRLTFKYACIFTTVPFEIYSIQFKMPYALYHDLIICRAKHPFLKQIIENVPLYRPMLNKPSATGPLFVSAQFMIYNQQKYYHTPLRRENKTDNSPYFYCSRLPDFHEDNVYVPNSKYFSFDLDWLYNLCSDFKSLSFTQRRGCFELSRRKRDIDNLTFTLSRWNLPIYTPVTNFLFRIHISYLAGDRIVK